MSSGALAEEYGTPVRREAVLPQPAGGAWCQPRMIARVAADWGAWLESWEAQQGRLMPERERRFAAIVEAVRVHCGPSPGVLDLGSGPGSLAVRILRAAPGASVLAIDRDPVLLELGRRALAEDARLRFADRDLGDPELADLGSGFDAAVTTTALHWLDLDALRRLYHSLSVMLRPGGLFLNGDRLHGAASGVEQLVTAVRQDREGRDGEVPREQTWDGWWERIQAEPALASAVEQRRRLGCEHPHHDHPPSMPDHEATLREAGFGSVGRLWQDLDDVVIAAIR